MVIKPLAGKVWWPALMGERRRGRHWARGRHYWRSCRTRRHREEQGTVDGEGEGGEQSGQVHLTPRGTHIFWDLSGCSCQRVQPGKGGTGELEVELLWGSGVTAGGSVGAGVRRAVKASSTWPRASAAMEAAMAEQWMRTEVEARLRVPLREINVATLALAT